MATGHVAGNKRHSLTDIVRGRSVARRGGIVGFVGYLRANYKFKPTELSTGQYRSRIDWV